MVIFSYHGLFFFICSSNIMSINYLFLFFYLLCRQCFYIVRSFDPMDFYVKRRFIHPYMFLSLFSSLMSYTGGFLIFCSSFNLVISSGFTNLYTCIYVCVGGGGGELFCFFKTYVFIVEHRYM